MVKLVGKQIYLSVLEREHCKILFDDFEYDFDMKTETLNIGYSIEKSDDWYENIQKRQGNDNIRLGIFLTDGTVIGDVALQGINWKNRVCDLGLGIAKIDNRGKGYGKEAVRLIIDYAFHNLGLERIEANTLEQNVPAQKSLEGLGFTLEGRQRKAVYMAGKRFDRLNYAILADEFRCKA